MIPIRETSAGVSFSVKVQPRARKNGITGTVGDALKLALTAPPVEGRANQAVIEFLAAVGGTMADRLGFRRALSLAYLILSCAYFMVGSITAPWLAPVRNVVPLTILATFILLLPALGVALVKPSVVGTTARASKEN